jgi:hypothetical protein
MLALDYYSYCLIIVSFVINKAVLYTSEHQGVNIVNDTTVLWQYEKKSAKDDCSRKDQNPTYYRFRRGQTEQ